MWITSPKCGKIMGNFSCHAICFFLLFKASRKKDTCNALFTHRLSTGDE
jgi:hypothetical protein